MDVKNVVAASLWAAGLYLAGLLIPILGEFAGLFAPAPLIIVYVRSGRRDGLAAIGLSAAIIAVLAGWQAASILLLGFCFMAAGTAEGMLRRLKPERAVLLGGVLPVGVLGLVLAVYSAQGGMSPIAVIEGHLKTGIGEIAKLYTSLGFREEAKLVTTASDIIVYYGARLTPSLAVAAAAVQAACCYGLARLFILRREGTASRLVRTSLAEWYAPDAWVWGLIAALVLIVIPSHAVRIAGWNLIILFFVVYTIQGTALLEHVLKRISVPGIGRGFIFAFILPLVAVFVTALGVLDIWADFRKVRAGEQKK